MSDREKTERKAEHTGERKMGHVPEKQEATWGLKKAPVASSVALVSS